MTAVTPPRHESSSARRAPHPRVMTAKTDAFLCSKSVHGWGLDFWVTVADITETCVIRDYQDQMWLFPGGNKTQNQQEQHQAGNVKSTVIVLAFGVLGINVTQVHLDPVYTSRRPTMWKRHMAPLALFCAVNCLFLPFERLSASHHACKVFLMHESELLCSNACRSSLHPWWPTK